MINFSKSRDIQYSSYFHQLDIVFLNYSLFPFALFFTPKLLTIFISIIFLCFNDKPFVGGIYIISILTCVAFTLTMKKMTKRKRPALLAKTRKSSFFRKKESNNAMPSGDSMQAANFIFFLMKYFYENEFGYSFYFFACLFVVFVCLSRVYFMCHYFTDTLVGSTIGFIIPLLISEIFFKIA